jgi:2-keto-4-pentenoate hydratase/2-oxohepta-3-ene-1,7-dioic acid hydratase in catechol pathway
MKLCRFQPLHFPAQQISRAAAGEPLRPEPLCGVVQGASVRQVAGSFFGAWSPTSTVFPLAEVKLLPPVAPSKIICLGRNYSEHAAELGNAVPKEPLIFLKPPSAVLGPEEPIVLTPLSQRVDYEGELAVILARRCSQLAAEADVAPYVLGYTCLNDVTARDLQKSDVQFTRAKGFDTFCPVGPVIETQLDLRAAAVETFVNGQRKQSAPVTEMIFAVDVIIRWVSRMMTLEPGDIISTGTPAGVGPLQAGDVVEVVVSGVGTLRNPVVALES